MNEIRSVSISNLPDEMFQKMEKLMNDLEEFYNEREEEYSLDYFLNAFSDCIVMILAQALAEDKAMNHYETLAIHMRGNLMKLLKGKERK